MMRPSVPHIYGKVKLEEDAFISCHHCDFTSYTFKGFSLHLRKVHGLSLTGKPPRRNKPRPPKPSLTNSDAPESSSSAAGAPEFCSEAKMMAQNFSPVQATSSTTMTGSTTTATTTTTPAAAATIDNCTSSHLVNEQQEMVKRLVAKREAARIRRAVRRGLRMRPSSNGSLGQVEVSFTCDRCNFTATCRNDFQNHILQRVCH